MPASTRRRPPDNQHRRLGRAPDERRWIDLKPKNVCLARSLEQNKWVCRSRARESNDLEVFSKGLTTVDKMGLTAKDTADVTAATDVAARLLAQDDTRAALASALAANEAADIEAAIVAMEAAHVDPFEVRAAHISARARRNHHRAPRASGRDGADEARAPRARRVVR